MEVGSCVEFGFDVIENVFCCARFEFNICNLKSTIFKRFKISVNSVSNVLCSIVFVFVLVLLLVFKILSEFCLG